MSKKFVNFVVFLSLVCAASVAQANNLTISNVSFGSRNPSTKTLVVTFDLAWENSWRNKINHDAVWLTLRLNNTASSPVYKKLCQVSAAGLNPEGSSTGSASNLEFYVPVDKAGAFLRRSSNGAVANVNTTSAQLTINYDSCGFSDSDQVSASVVGFEMVFVPQGSFYAGDFNTSAASLNIGSGNSNPLAISSENAVAGEDANGYTFTAAATFPKGYKAFYVMKYEITEGQWVEFINSLPSDAARAAHDVTDNNHKNSDSVIARNSIACSGTPLTCSTQRSSRAANYLNWSDVAAFLDFNALRPVSELEFEKMARGPLMSVAGEYAWGTTDIAAAAALTATEDGTETVTTAGANAHYSNTTLTGGDASTGAEYAVGALRNGIFATSTATRVTAGAGYYGVMDLSGNVKERVVTLGNAAGLSFTGVHGDGVLTATSGYEGNADSALWPGLDATAGRGVTGAAGSGFRGGSWADAALRLRISDRFEAALTSNTADNVSGGRGARTYDGN
jgi:formylglycine-generating enzyme required for sulfatase activity